MALKRFFMMEGGMEATIEDLKKIDIWAYGMVLFKICNPHIKYPYHHDIKQRKDKLNAMQRLIKEGKRPTTDAKYAQLQSKEWKTLQEFVPKLHKI